MSRNAKDLRDLICVSRLSIRDYESDDDNYSSDSASGWSSSSVGNNGVAYYQTQTEPITQVTPRSACSTRNDTSLVVGRPRSAVGAVPRPKPTAVSPRNVGASPLYEGSTRILTSRLSRMKVYEEGEGHESKIGSLLDYADATIVADMLVRCTDKLTMISKWLQRGNNYVDLCHFSLSRLSVEQRDGLINLEYSIVKDELKVVFGASINDRLVTDEDLVALLKIIIPEYPSKLVQTNDGAFLLHVLYKLCNIEPGSAKKLLSNIKYSTRNKNHIQWMLGIRAFALINMADGVIQFYDKVNMANSLLLDGLDLKAETCSDRIVDKWVISSIELGFVDVLSFLVKRLKVDIMQVKDQYKRNVVMVAVMNQQCNVLSYIFSQTVTHPEVNEVTDTGNTPLHVAISKGNFELVKLLIDAGADPNAKNAISDGGTPLHSAVLNGNIDIVRLLISKGADINSKMGEKENVTPLSLAKDIGEEEIAKILSDQEPMEEG